MQLLVLDLEGKMAHFRKYFANNTAMSYSLPPRTTVMGMLAAIMGLPRDGYYGLLGSARLQLGLRIVNPVKKSFHRLNYLKVESSSQFTGSNGRIQVPVEIVTGRHPRHSQLCYRLYVAAGTSSQGGESFEQLHQHLRNKGGHYPVSFGAAPFAARLKQWQLAQASSMPTPAAPVLMHSAVPTQYIKQVALPAAEAFRQIEEELLPADFMVDGTRKLQHMNRLLYATDGQPLPLALNSPYWQVQYPTIPDTEHISFMA